MLRKFGLALLAGTTMLWPSQAFAMPQAIAGAILPLIVSSPLYFLGPAAISAIASGLGYAAVIGAVSLAQYALTPRPAQPKPEDVQTNFRQPVPIRSALYGQGLLGGPWAFGATKGDFFYRVFALASRKLSAIDEIWVDDIEDVTLSSNVISGADVLTDPYEAPSGEGSNYLRVEARLGNNPNTHYSHLSSAFSAWTSEHRGDGVASVYTRFRGPDPEDVQKFWPDGINTQIRARCRGVAVYDPRSGSQDKDDPETWTYSDNLARVIFDYMRHEDGFRIPDSIIATPMALEGWRQAVDDSADAIDLAAGGTEPRYRIWGTYKYSERPADVLTRFMAAGNARIKPVPDGGYTLEVGTWREPEVTIDETMIVSFDGLARGRNVMQAANVVYGQFTSAGNKFQSTDAQPWVDEADVAERGEISIAPDYLNAPSHGQCRRLMKIEAHRANPTDVGTFVCNKAGLIAYGERFITIRYPEMDVSGSFEVMDFEFVFGEHGILKGCKISVQSIGANAYAWDAATEEGSPGETENPPSSDPFAAPDGFDVTMEAGGDAAVEWDAPDSSAWVAARVQVENLTDPNGTDEFTVAPGDGETTITGLTADDDYRFRMRFEANVSATSWTGWLTRTALA